MLFRLEKGSLGDARQQRLRYWVILESSMTGGGGESQFFKGMILLCQYANVKLA